MKAHDIRLRISALKFTQSAASRRAEVKQRLGAAAVAGKGPNDPAWRKWRAIGYSAAYRVNRLQKEIEWLASELRRVEKQTPGDIADRMTAAARAADLDKAIAEL